MVEVLNAVVRANACVSNRTVLLPAGDLVAQLRSVKCWNSPTIPFICVVVEQTLFGGVWFAVATRLRLEHKEVQEHNSLLGQFLQAIFLLWVHHALDAITTHHHGSLNSSLIDFLFTFSVSPLTC